MEYVINTHSITKVYKKSKVVNEMNLQLYEGEIYGLLGENGAGKTTFMKILTNLIKPTSGNIDLFGKPLELNNNLLKEVGVLIETPVFYDSLSALENLEIHCKYKQVNIETIPAYLKMLGIYEVKDKKVKEFSLGMKQRLGIVRSIIDEPKLLILDEPTNGLDPNGIKEMRELLLYLAKEKKTTILISSHILSEIENMADRIGFMHNGVLIKEIANYELENIRSGHESLEDYFVQIIDRG